MNFLAHVLLAGDNAALRLGAMAGDFVKGPLDTQPFPAGLRAGLRLHRFIDMHTDHHPVVSTSKNRLQPPLRRFAGILLDLVFDHFLACEWAQHHPQPLDMFSAQVYRLLMRNRALLPIGLQRILPAMVASDWLYSYRELAAVVRTANRLAQRDARWCPLQRADAVLQQHYTHWQQDFAIFFPQLKAACTERLELIYD